MAKVIFPSGLKPNQRSFTPGSYPSTEFQSQDGTKTHLRYGNRRVDATLVLGFVNITDDQVVEILNHYDSVMSVYDHIEFSNENGALGIEDSSSNNVFKEEITGSIGGDGTTRSKLKWRYSAPPNITSVFLGRSNVSCSFVACLDAP